MSAESRPISAAAFAQAIQDLPAENLYLKASEIRNSIAHLERSNTQLQQYSDSIANDTNIPEEVRGRGDRECLEAIRENAMVIERQRERVALLKREVERRGGRWHEAGDGDEDEGLDRLRDRVVNGGGAGREEDDATPELTRASTMETTASRGTGGGGVTGRGGGRLTDEELRRQLAERMAGEYGEQQEEDGMHL